MIESASSLTMTVPNIIASSPSGGRFDFDDGGTYCGGWQDGKAHGHGVCTGPKNVGEYSGSWNFGFEMSGVYKWTNGAVYEGRWQNGKRHGVGVEYNGKWIYKGEWSQGLKGRYGVKASSNSAVKYEGTWANGLQDGYGSETYSDGGYYQGQMCRGLRHGYGVRKSAPYGDSQLNNPSKNGPIMGGPSSSMLIHSNSMQSSGSAVDLSAAGLPGAGDDDSPKPEDGFKPNIDRTLVSKNGFVLVSKPLDVPMPNPKSMSADSSSSSGSRRRNSLTNRLASTARIPNTATSSLLRGLRLKRQKSSSDLDVASGRSKSPAGSVTSQSQRGQQSDELPIVPFTLSPEELDITDPTTVETYTGEWKHDKRNGHGVCDRSDGLRYEGQWHNDMKCGYGVTTFKDGTKEEGKYKNNILIVDSKVKRFFQLGASNIRQRIDDSVKMAQQAQTMALKKAEIADTRAATARDKADQAMTAAIEADRDSQIAYSVARQYSDTQQQQQQQLRQMEAAGFGAPPTMFMSPAAMGPAGQNPANYPEHQPHLPNLNIASSPLQMRRISQHQQRNFYQSQQQNSIFQQQQDHPQQQQQQARAGQYLGPVEPFNGRRGSFRGGSLQAPSSGYHPPAGGSSRLAGQQPQMPPHPSLMNRQSADPFNDLFDHYKSSAASNYPAASFRSRRSMLSKQTSLDHSQMRHTSVPRQLGGQGERMRRFRMSSLDHAEEHHQAQGRMSQEMLMQQQQQQFRHLVTSGEDLQQLDGQQQQQQFDQQVDQDQQQNQQHNQKLNAPTPTGSSYILPRSSGAGSSSTAGNYGNFSNHSVSPSDRTQSQLASTNGSMPQPAGPYYNGQRAHNYAQHAMMQQYQRDTNSLADEQLYMTRRRNEELLDRTEYSNYDFTISSGPRPTARCMRRTASMSRTTPINVSHLSLTSRPHLQFDSTPVSGSHGALAPSTSRFHPQQQQRQQPHANEPLPANSSQKQAVESRIAGDPNNLLAPSACHLSPNSCDSSLSSASPLNRKPSLQVRYDPVQLGGLMSREEVAALSHAQREQKRLEAELAEMRTKRPLLHLVLTLKEFITRHQLIISVLFINACLMKMFADLIV